LHSADGTQFKHVDADYGAWPARDINWGMQWRQPAQRINPETSCMKLKAVNHLN
jgi:hypothetical protein